MVIGSKMVCMKILLIESPNLDLDWLKSYVGRYDTRSAVIGVRTIRQAIEFLHKDFDVDIILLDPNTYDALSPGILTELIDSAPKIPIVILVTGKTMHYECIRTPGTRIYHLKTDVSQETFLMHLKGILEELEMEKKGT
jgi:DNA-binding NtrC family response regulator